MEVHVKPKFAPPLFVTRRMWMLERLTSSSPTVGLNSCASWGPLLVPQSSETRVSRPFNLQHSRLKTRRGCLWIDDNTQPHRGQHLFLAYSQCVPYDGPIDIDKMSVILCTGKPFRIH